MSRAADRTLTAAAGGFAIVTSVFGAAAVYTAAFPPAAYFFSGAAASTGYVAGEFASGAAWDAYQCATGKDVALPWNQ